MLPLLSQFGSHPDVKKVKANFCLFVVVVLHHPFFSINQSVAERNVYFAYVYTHTHTHACICAKVSLKTLKTALIKNIHTASHSRSQCECPHTYEQMNIHIYLLIYQRNIHELLMLALLLALCLFHFRLHKRDNTACLDTHTVHNIYIWYL